MNLPDLPASTDKEFWGESEIELSDTKTRSKKEHSHKFERVTAKEIRCECGFGLFIDDPEDELINGHLYHAGQKIF